VLEQQCPRPPALSRTAHASRPPGVRGDWCSGRTGGKALNPSLTTVQGWPQRRSRGAEEKKPESKPSPQPRRTPHRCSFREPWPTRGQASPNRTVITWPFAPIDPHIPHWSHLRDGKLCSLLLLTSMFSLASGTRRPAPARVRRVNEHHQEFLPLGSGVSGAYGRLRADGRGLMPAGGTHGKSFGDGCRFAIGAT
jgi:hypothetical protein